MKRQRDEAQAAAEQREKEAAHYGVLDNIMRRRTENNLMSGGSGGYSAAEGAASNYASWRYRAKDFESGAAEHEGGHYSHTDGANCERSYSHTDGAADHASGRYSPHSPTYPPYDEEPEPEPEEQEEPRTNPMFAYDEDEEGWATR
jgi:hypothetical protein